MKSIKNLSVILGLMLMTSIFMGLGFVKTASADTHTVAAGTPIQNAINASSTGDTVVVAAGYYPKDLIVNKSITLVSAAGYATTWINGTVNITNSTVQIGNMTGNGFTIYKSAITVGNRAVVIGNSSQNNVKIYRCEIIGGYDGINIGARGKNCSNITIYYDNIHGQGKSAINASSGTLRDSNISTNLCFNSSNTDTGAIMLFDGGYNDVIWNNIIHTSTDNGGEGINFTGKNNATDKVNIMKNTIYNTAVYSPIIIRSLAATEYVQNMKIELNVLTNNSNGLTSPAVRFDNISGKITASNITTSYNQILTSSRDIEERFALTATYKNWTGIMPAFFNWYGSATAGTFRNSSHLYATPYLITSSAVSEISSRGILQMVGATTGTLNATTAHLLTGTVTSTNNLVVVAYPYPTALLTTYPARSMHKYVELGVSDTSHVTFPVNITIYYNTSDLATRGWDEDEIHGMVFYNETSAEWQQFNDTGVITTNQWGGFLGLVWAKAYNAYELTGTLLGIDYNTITTTPGGGTTTPPSGGTTTPPATGETATGLIFGLPMSTWILVIILIIVLIVVSILVIILLNPKLRRKISRWL